MSDQEVIEAIHEDDLRRHHRTFRQPTNNCSVNDAPEDNGNGDRRRDARRKEDDHPRNAGYTRLQEPKVHYPKHRRMDEE